MFGMGWTGTRSALRSMDSDLYFKLLCLYLSDVVHSHPFTIALQTAVLAGLLLVYSSS